MSNMGNMGYCRFENTYDDLQECYDALQDEGFEGVLSSANRYERRYVKKLIELCKDIADEFGDADDIDDEEE